MAEKQKTIGNIPNEEFAAKVSGAIDKGRKNAKRKVEQVKADDEYTEKDAVSVDRPELDRLDADRIVEKVTLYARQAEIAELRWKKRREQFRDVRKFLMTAGALFLGTFGAMCVYGLIFG